MRPRSRGNEGGGLAEIVAFTAAHHGVISLAQLLELGLGRSGVGSWVARGRLHPIHQGVFAVRRRDVSAKGRWMAAVLACGESAIRSQAEVLRVYDQRAVDEVLGRANGRATERPSSLQS